MEYYASQKSTNDHMKHVVSLEEFEEIMLNKASQSQMAKYNMSSLRVADITEEFSRHPGLPSGWEEAASWGWGSAPWSPGPSGPTGLRPRLSPGALRSRGEAPRHTIRHLIEMETFLETLQILGKVLYYLSESLVYMIIPKRKKSVAGEIVLITGAGSGLGRQLAIKFARLGAILVLWDINKEGNMETSRQVQENGGVKVFTYTCDCSNRQEVYSVANQVKQEVGDVTILINNAGMVTGKMFLDIPDHMIEKSFLINTLSHFWTYKAFLPAMIEANHGHLVCISSAAGLIGCARLADYSASKFAACGVLESLFIELNMNKQNKIKTTIICPYFIKTGMFDGCTTKYPFLLPLMDTEYVTQTTVNAILEEDFYTLIPKFLYVALTPKLLVKCLYAANSNHIPTKLKSGTSSPLNTTTEERFSEELL
ncbi:epidermal retinol dehydrogenase 2 [Echinops telfairi]|uniref:Epidermal retinol dehydrogenase 2 n=1 Tax=Echinops telfairi TaxID=9371 RepID=A0ABM0IDV7_ECHTE|nr:epidermal retinol dehydrogenase 2 [Echinops telfairi]